MITPLRRDVFKESLGFKNAFNLDWENEVTEISKQTIMCFKL
jgi:hypothetical protein